MNNKVLFAIPISLLLAACVPPPAPSPPGTLTCMSSTPTACAGDKNNPLVVIDLDAKTVDPECIKAKKGRVIIFELVSTSDIAKNSVEIRPKDGSDDWWLAGANTPNKKRILVLAPKKKEDGSNFPTDDYEYEVHTPDWCMDPRVHVEN